MKKVWWKEAVAYQIYPLSFMDSNGDGIGDLSGITTKLDYLKDLGIDVIWICPVYKSPNDDNGYDISDYQDILEQFGTMQDFDHLLHEVHARGMKLIMDLVINHTSDEHPWFIESRKDKTNDKRDYYIWSDSKHGAEPNNWESIFGGPAWEYDEATDQYYMHVFSRKQPDLNWENPKVRLELYNTVNWWLDKGIDGFRVDAISHIKKVAGFPDLPNPKGLPYVPSFEGHMNREGIHEFLDELKQETFAKYDIMTVGEANGVSVKNLEDAELWVGSDKGKFNMVFQFEHLKLWNQASDGNLNLLELKKTFSSWQKGLEGFGWNALFLENHDLPRSVSTWGNDQEHRVRSAKALATLYFLMQGTPFLYQGQEIGMTNVQFDSIEDYNDVAIKNLYRIETANGTSHEEIMSRIWKTGRDNSRTPMQWSDRQNAGFTTGTPWMKVNPNYKEINVELEQKNPDSIYHYYKQLIQLRKSYPAAVYGTYDLVAEDHPYIYAYSRTLNNKKLVMIINLFAVDCEWIWPEDLLEPSGKLLLSNYQVMDTESVPREITFRPYESRVYYMTSER
ncbi:alpha-glucosidase [Cohnella abietis]|uniref:Alpha-amylase n=1 Tax=Cohnella abietis TaxID=2507935 RepID=A0A3T1CZ88_9BACL|nr:alpha-glucosidase [Cohnella abietis]BBI31160.1 alpha-glucosidase [Cohnella abietis]